MELCEARPETLLSDKGYDSNAIREDLEQRGIEPVIRQNPTANGSNATRRPTSIATSSSVASMLSSSFAESPPAARKRQEPTSPCHVRPHALAEPTANPMNRLHRQLFAGLDRHEAHVWPADRLADGSRVIPIVLIGLHIKRDDCGLISRTS